MKPKQAAFQAFKTGSHDCGIPVVGGHGKQLYCISMTTAPARLSFVSLLSPIKLEMTSGLQRGYICVFEFSFMPKKVNRRLNWLQKASFSADLDKVTSSELSRVFELIIAEQHSRYPYKMLLIRNYIVQIIHCVLKIKDCQS